MNWITYIFLSYSSKKSLSPAEITKQEVGFCCYPCKTRLMSRELQMLEIRCDVKWSEGEVKRQDKTRQERERETPIRRQKMLRYHFRVRRPTQSGPSAACLSKQSAARMIAVSAVQLYSCIFRATAVLRPAHATAQQGKRKTRRERQGEKENTANNKSSALFGALEGIRFDLLELELELELE